jgi:hypothetical protein
MATKGIGFVSLLDVAKKGDKVAEVLTLKNKMMGDIPYMEMNEGTTHKESIRSFLPSPKYRKANQALAAAKSGLEERTFSAAHFESRSQMDAKVAQRGGMDRVALNRWNQAMGHIQAMANEHARLMIYGSPSGEGNKEPGLADIYYTKTTATSETAKNVVDAAGSGSDNTSIYLINWNPNSVFGVYPKGTQAGLKRTDYSEGGKLVQLQGLDDTGAAGTFYGYDEIFEIDHGLVVKDWRQCARIANIDVSDLKAGSGTNPQLLDLLITAQYRLDDMSGAVIYCNRTVHGMLHKQALSQVKAGGGLTFMNYGGETVLSFNGMPIRIQDAILETEAAVT